MKVIPYLFLYITFCSCTFSTKKQSTNTAIKIASKDSIKATPPLSKKDSITNLFKNHPDFKTNGFDFPVGKPNAIGYYNAQKFKENNHLGEDWNAVTGGNSDLGAPIYAIANGYLHFAEDIGRGWGKVIPMDT